MPTPPPQGPDRPGSGPNPEPGPEQAYSRLPGGRALAPLSDPLVPADLRGWLERVGGVVRRSLVPLLMIQLGVAAVSALLSYTLNPLLARGPDPDGVIAFLALLGMAVAIGVGVFAQGASAYVAIRDASGRPTTAAQALRFAAGRAPLLVGWGLVAGMLTGFGLLLLIVPGLYLAVVFGATLAGVVAVERDGILRCFALVNRRFWPTMGRMALAVAAGLGYSLVASFVVGALSAPGSFIESVLQAVITVPMGMAAVGVAVVSYAELRFHERPDVLTPTLAAELER